MRLAAALLLTHMGGCAGPTREAAVPAATTEQATVLGMSNARFWADTQGPAMVQEGRLALTRQRDAQGSSVDTESGLQPANLLAISGGSDNGAFGAGLLIGWAESATRPSFNLVARISTGALIAPFAFLGATYDEKLRAVYTAIGPADVYERR